MSCALFTSLLYSRYMKCGISLDIGHMQKALKSLFCPTKGDNSSLCLWGLSKCKWEANRHFTYEYDKVYCTLGDGSPAAYLLESAAIVGRTYLVEFDLGLLALVNNFIQERRILWINSLFLDTL